MDLETQMQFLGGLGPMQDVNLQRTMIGSSHPATHAWHLHPARPDSTFHQVLACTRAAHAAQPN